MKNSPLSNLSKSWSLLRFQPSPIHCFQLQATGTWIVSTLEPLLLLEWPLLLDLILCLSQRQVIGESRQLAHLFWSLLFPFIFLSIPVRSWDDSSNPLLSFISLTMGFCQSISSDFIKWRSSSDLTWLAGSLPQSLTGARLVIYQSTVAFLPPTS